MQYSKHILPLCFCALLTAFTGHVALGNDDPDWRQESALGQDIAVSHDGAKWFVGKNGAAYKWNNTANDWQKYGSRSNLIRIDAGVNGAAAIADNGQIYVADNAQKTWQPTGIIGGDIGIGGGKIWVANARTKQGRATLTADFNPNGKMKWSVVSGALVSVDVDPNGRPWGVDKNGHVFVFAEGAWVADQQAPKASDIGVGGNGALYVIGTDVDQKLGGGRVYQRNGQTGVWTKMPGRLTAISVNKTGQAVGVNSRQWLMTGQMNTAPVERTDINKPTYVAGQGSNTETSNTGTIDKIDIETLIRKGVLTLADILGSGLPGADKIELTETKITEDTISGVATVDGAPVRAILHQPDMRKPVFIAGLEHQSIDLGRYIPKIRNTSLGSFGLGNAVFYIQGENAEPISYEKLEDMPAALSSILGKGDYNGLFPLIIHPGVTVVGTYVPADNNATTVMKAYGLEEKGYAVKGHFKLSQIGNVSFASYDAGKPEKPSKKEICEFAISPGASGLDLTIPLPDYKPKYAEGSVAFHGSEFTLKEIDGKIEPAILTGMTFKAPEAEFGISDITMAGKLSVQGDLNVICNGVDAKTEGQISFAAATSYNTADISDMAFAALERVSEDGVESPKTDKELGWQKPFGIPFLTIRHYAVAGTFEQKEENGDIKRSLDTAVWMQSRIDRAELDVTGKATYEVGETGLKLEGWSFELPGPVALNDLPALKDMPKVDEFTVSDIELTPHEMVGRLQRQNKNLNASIYLGRTEKEDKTSDVQLFVAFDSFKPTMIYDFIPETMADVTLAPALMAWRTQETGVLKYADAAKKLQPLLKTWMNEDGEITLAQGLTIGGKTTPDQIFNGHLSKLPEKYLAVEGGIQMLGTFVANDKGNFKGQVEAALDTFKIKQIPDSLMTFSGSKLVLSNLAGHKIEIETSAKVKVPEKKDPITMLGALSFEQEDKENHKLSLSLASELAWNTPFAIPDLSISDLGFEAHFERKGDKVSDEMGFTGRGLFRKQGGDVAITLTGNEKSLEDLVVSFDGAINMSDLFEMPAGASDIAGATLRKLYLSKNAVAGDLAFNLGNMSFDGRAAVIEDNGHHALFLRQDQKLEIGKILDDIPKPLNDLTIPKGLLILSDKQVQGFNAGDIPNAIYENVLAGLIADDIAYSLLVEDGLTFYTQINVDDVPPLPRQVMKTPFGISGEIPVGGSVGGLFGSGDPSIGFYTHLQNMAPTLPSFVKNFVDFGTGKVKIFVRSTTGTEGKVQVGLETAAKIMPRRLDKPDVIQPLDAIFNLTYTAAVNDLKMTAGASVVGKWSHPMGLENYHFTNPSFAFGIEEKGTVIEIHTDRAEFTEAGEKKAFVLDLSSTWAGIVPTDLAIQFVKTKDTDKLTLTPITLARIQKSIFDLVFNSASNLSTQVLKHLNGTAKSTFETFSDKLSDAQNGMFSLIEQSPLSMIAVENPVIYFGTPGSTPPRNDDADIKYPPLGLGLYVGGAFIVDTGALKANLAEGEYMINLIDGYKVNGKVTPPSPFSQNTFTVSGNMPLLGGKQSLSFAGSLDIPTMPIPTFPLTGTFDMTRGAFTSPNASIHAHLSAGDNSIKDLTTIEGGMSLTGRNLSFSMPLGNCIPLEVSADNMDIGSPDSLAVNIAGSFRPAIPNPLDCAVDLGEAILNMGEEAYNAGKSLVTDPVGSGESLVEGAGELVTDPGAALENATELGKMPLNMAEMGAGLGISLVKMGLEKVPVLGPGAAQAVGEAFGKASALKDEALGALASNSATKWLSDGIGESLGAVSGVASKALGSISDWGSSVFGGKKAKAPVWYRINPLRCKPGFHYWNATFKQCFEYGSVVLFDDATRQGNSVGDCMRVKYRSDAPLTVGKCFGDATAQFTLDPSTDQITSSWYSYYGYDGGWYGPGRPECLTRASGPNGKVFLDSCHKNTANSKWTYTDDMKLKNGHECMTRNTAGEVVMGSCASANKWLGTSVMPNWNEVEDIPMRGQITHQSSGLCWYWEGGGPYKLKTCSTEDTSKRNERIALRSHTNLRVLDDQHTVEIMGSRAWDGQVNYACLGANSSGNAFGNNACNPDVQDNKNKWQVLAVKADGTLDTGMNISLKDSLKGTYVFKNVSTGTCLYVDNTQANKEAVNPLRFSGGCTNWGKARAQAQFTGYEADNLSEWVRILAKDREERAFRDAREQLKGNIQQWQRWRIRQENARMDQTFKTLQHMSTNTKVARFNRKSPGHCVHGTFWNNNLKRCSKDSKLMLLYNDADGRYKGCLRSEMVGTMTPGLWQDCRTDQESDAFIDVISFIFDDQGRIVKFNKDYQVKTKTQANKEGKNETFVVGTSTITSKDTCLMPTNSFQRIEGKQRVNFMYCGDHASQKWRYSSQGELISHDGQCLREQAVTKTNGYNIANVRLRDRLERERRAALVNKWKSNTSPGYIAEYQAFKAQLKIDYPTYNLTKTTSYLVLDDCKSDPMQGNNRRWLPSIGQNFSAQQELPESAQIKLAGNDNICVTGDMILNGKITLQSCANDNKDQYFAFGGIDRTRFLISSRNSKTCIYDAGDNTISHGACRSKGTEMFLKIPQPNGTVKLQNASSGKCLSTGATTLAGDQDIVQIDCDTAVSFKLETVKQLEGITFADIGELQINPEKSEQWHVMNEKLKRRASLLYGGSYLSHGDNTLQKGAEDEAILAPITKTATLKKLPSHMMPSGNVFYIPSIDVPETSIILVPGFEDGADHVTFAHGMSVRRRTDDSIVDIADPYAPTYANWFKFAHIQKIMHVADDQGNLKFDYIDESPEFRQTATFKMVPALSGQENMYSFLSLSNPGQYLLQQNGKLIVGPAHATQGSFNLEGTSKWMKNDDLNLIDPKPPLRKAQPYFKYWKFPDTAESVLNKDY